jgi:S1-C subfamily serine protease
MEKQRKYSYSWLKQTMALGGLLLLPGGLVSAALSEEALADLVKPGVVRIAEHVTGTARIPAIKVDIRSQFVTVIPDRYTEVPIDEYLSGTGFIIHPDGYIATNAHVVSLQTIKTTLASESALSAVFENALLLSDQEMDAFLRDEASQQFSREIIRYVIEKSVFDLHHDLAVLRPGASPMPIAELIATGLPAEIVAENESFMDTSRDVALLKVEAGELPALALGRAEDLSVGSKVYIFGFPATAEINEKDPSEATFTRGVVSAIRESEDGQFKIFQTDAKVSEGSSGGPLFNEVGQVLGLVTFQTDELTRSAGDNFAFALPIRLVEELALEARVLPEEGRYGEYFRQGFAAFMERHCDVARTAFSETKTTNPLFLTDEHVMPYLTKCQEWQDAGIARDTYWEELRDSMRTLGSPLTFVLGGSLVSFGIFGAMILWLLRALRREEHEIDVLEERLLADERELRRHESLTEKRVPPRKRSVRAKEISL